MPEPSAYNVDLDSGFQQVNGCRVSKDVRGDHLRLTTAFFFTTLTGMALHDLIDAETGQGIPIARSEDRTFR